MPKLLTVKDIARLANASEITVRRWIYSGGMKARKMGGLVRVEEREWERFWNKQPVITATDVRG